MHPTFACKLIAVAKGPSGSSIYNDNSQFPKRKATQSTQNAMRFGFPVLNWRF